MNNIEDVYKNLTSVDINSQQRIWDDRGKGYFGEFEVFKSLYYGINSNCKFLMNLNIPISNGKTTEIDLVMIHETGIYVFEVKHYKGIIYGDTNGDVWTQYFKTQKNSVFNNPLFQNAYHIKALEKILPNSTFYSVVVFSNNECTLKINQTNNSETVCKLVSLGSIVNREILCRPIKYTVEEIDEIFKLLSQYSPLTEEKIEENGDKISLYEFVDKMEREYKNKVNDYQIKCDIEANHTKNLCEQKVLAAKKSKRATITICCLMICIAVAFSIFSNISYKKLCDSYVEQANAEVLNMRKNFQTVDESDIPYNDIINEIVSVEVDLKKSVISNTVTFNGKLYINPESKYAIKLTDKSKYIVITDDGKSYQYDLFNTVNRYNVYNNILNPNGGYGSGVLKEYDFIGIGDVSHIKYIKVTDVALLDTTTYSLTEIVTGLEIELYSK